MGAGWVGRYQTDKEVVEKVDGKRWWEHTQGVVGELREAGRFDKEKGNGGELRQGSGNVQWAQGN
jgi:hypothetical protein